MNEPTAASNNIPNMCRDDKKQRLTAPQPPPKSQFSYSAPNLSLPSAAFGHASASCNNNFQNASSNFTFPKLNESNWAGNTQLFGRGASPNAFEPFDISETPNSVHRFNLFAESNSIIEQSAVEFDASMFEPNPVFADSSPHYGGREQVLSMGLQTSVPAQMGGHNYKSQPSMKRSNTML